VGTLIASVRGYYQSRLCRIVSFSQIENAALIGNMGTGTYFSDVRTYQDLLLPSIRNTCFPPFPFVAESVLGRIEQCNLSLTAQYADLA
jgi:hypothetical protein